MIFDPDFAKTVTLSIQDWLAGWGIEQVPGQSWYQFFYTPSIGTSDMELIAEKILVGKIVINRLGTDEHAPYKIFIFYRNRCETCDNFILECVDYVHTAEELVKSINKYIWDSGFEL